MANLMLSVMGAFAEFERALLKEWKRGAYRSLNKALNNEQVADLKNREAAGQPKTQVTLDFGISRETLYQYLRADSTQ